MGRATWFHILRVLRLSREQFEALPWHDSRMYLETLAEYLRPDGGDGPDESDDLSVGGFTVETV